RVPGHGGAAGRRGAAPADHRSAPAAAPPEPRAGRLRGRLRGPAGRRQALREVSGPGGPVGEAASVAGVWGGRAAGVLLHPTSLPGPHGVGELGPEAVRWLDLLAAAGQRVWQVLPLGPTGYGDSPYQSFSAFAGNPYLIDVGALAAAGLVADAELDPLRALPSRRVDFGGLYALKLPLLRRAADAFLAAGGESEPAFRAFREREAAWLEDFALFMRSEERRVGKEWRSRWWPELGKSKGEHRVG